MRLLTYVVPLVLVVLFLWRGRRDPVYILAVPLLLTFGRAIFLDLYTLHLTLGGGFAFNQEDVLLLALLGVLAYVAVIRPVSPAPFTLQLYLCVGLLILMAGKTVAAAVDVPGTAGLLSGAMSALKAALAARAYFYLPLSIIIWHQVLRRFSISEVMRLFRLLTWVTVGCAVLYIANLAGVRTYSTLFVQYSTRDVDVVGSVTRDYLTLPVWLFLAVAYALARVVYGSERVTYALVALVTTPCAVASFTRAYAVSALGLWALAGLWRFVVAPTQRRDNRPHRARMPLAGFVVLAACAALSVAVVRSAALLSLWWTLLAARFGHLSHGLTGDPNIMLRVSLYAQASKSLASNGYLLGGLLTSPKLPPPTSQKCRDMQA